MYDCSNNTCFVKYFKCVHPTSVCVYLSTHCPFMHSCDGRLVYTPVKRLSCEVLICSYFE